MKRQLWLAAIGLAVGLGIGLFLGWNVWPVEFFDTEFSAFHADYKLEYAVMVGAAYELDGDWETAANRLAALAEPDLPAWVRDVTHRAIAGGRDPTEIRHLVSLAEQLGVKTEIMQPFTGG